MKTDEATQRPRLPCVYCGEPIPLGEKDQEHCVGRQFFAKPLPVDLDRVVVPSCRKCNKRWKTDEDYVRAMVAHTDAGTTVVGKKHVTQLHTRAFPKDTGLRASIASRVSRVEPRTPSGIVLRPVLAQTIDWNRVDRVLRKWTCGLYWKEYGERLAPGSTVTGAMTSIAGLGATFHGSEPSVGAGSWPNTFQYWFSRDAIDPARSRWSFLLWGRLALVVATNQTMPIAEVDLFAGFGA
jgi:hypothetical protein